MADPVTAAALIVAGTAVTAGSQIIAGRSEENVAKYESEQIEDNARQRYAQGTREAYEELRAGRIRVGNERASQAASGGVTDDAGALNDLALIGDNSRYNAFAALYDAQREAEGLSKQASARRTEGRIAKRSGNLRALSTVITGGTKAYGAMK